MNFACDGSILFFNLQLKENSTNGILSYHHEDECLSVNLKKAETLKHPDRLSVSDMNPIAMVHILPDRR
jgi:hypothetical protein